MPMDHKETRTDESATPTNDPPNEHVEKRSESAQSSNADRAEKGGKLEGKTEEERPYSVLNKGQKWFIVAFIAFAGLFSPLTSSIYLPAIPTLTVVFHKSTELINLTVTIYIVMQGLAPMVWGPVSDRWGRRIAFCLCMLILALTCIGLALTPTNAYWLLMLLRCLQAAGSASTIAIGAGVIGDISVAKERGGFFGVFTLGPMIGPAVAPTIGGALSNNLGWRAIFWFLTIAASISFVIMFLFLPETLRSRVGDGSVVPSFLHRPVIPLLHYKGEPHPDTIPAVKPNPNPLLLLIQFDIVVLLTLTGIVCSVYYGFIATISTLFHETYPDLNQTELGLCFLAIGGGMAVGTVVNGKVLDLEYKSISKKLAKGKDSEDFPIEKARLRLLPFYILLSAICCAGYGFCLKQKVSIAAPLVLQFLVGYVSIAVMNSASTLMVDLFPGQGSSITACNNLVRCTLSAILVSVIDLIIRGIGVQWTYVLIAGLNVISIPLIYLTIRIGPGYRKKRKTKIR